MTTQPPIAKALETVSEAAHSLAVHGAGGYSTDSSALDVVFVRSLLNLAEQLMHLEGDYFDPRGEIYEALQNIL